MKSFKHYIAESVHTYDVTVKVAGEVDKNFLDMFMHNLKSKFNAVEMSKPTTTPVQKNPYGFPNLANEPVTIIKCKFRYPATEPMIQQMAQLLGYNVNMVRLVDSKYDESITMMHIKAKKCVGCKKKQPTFNYEGKKPEYCGDCKNPNMINVKDTACNGHHCKKKLLKNRKRASYYIDNDEKLLFCNACANYEVNNDSTRVHIINREKCVYIENGIRCKKLSFYGDIDKKKSHCGEHRKINQVRRPNYMCYNCKKKPALWGNYNFIRMRC